MSDVYVIAHTVCVFVPYTFRAISNTGLTILPDFSWIHSAVPDFLLYVALLLHIVLKRNKRALDT